MVCFIILAIRRKTIGGELGGPWALKVVSAVILVCCWLFYIVMATFQNYGIVAGF